MDRLSVALIVAWVGACLWVGPPTGDIANYVVAGRMWLDGADLATAWDYRVFTTAAAQAGYGDQLVGLPVLPPHTALIGAPLALLGPWGAALVWWAGQAVLGVVLAVVAARAARLPTWVGLAALFLLWPAFHGHLVQGQFHLPAVVLVAAGLLAFRHDRDALAGLCWGLAAGLKVYAWPLLLVPLLFGRWRVTASGAATLAAGAVVAIGLLGWGPHAVFFGQIAPAAAVGRFTDPWHPYLQGAGTLARALFLPDPVLNPVAPAHLPALARYLPAALSVAVLAAVAIAARDARVLGAASIAALVGGPILPSYHLTLLLPGLLWGVGAAWEAGDRRRAGIALAAAAVAAWMPIPGVWPEGWWRVFATPRLWAVVVCFVALLPPTWGRRPWAAVALLPLLLAPAWPRGPEPVVAPGMPLVAADLLEGPDGSVYFAGLPTDRSAHPGRGWLGYRYADGEGLSVVADRPGGHVGAPRVDGTSVVFDAAPTGLRAASGYVLSDVGVGVRAYRLCRAPVAPSVRADARRPRVHTRGM